LFNLAIDNKLRGCDVDGVAPSGYAMDRATIQQKKTGRPVRFELTDQTRLAIDEYLRTSGPGRALALQFAHPRLGHETKYAPIITRQRKESCP